MDSDSPALDPNSAARISDTLLRARTLWEQDKRQEALGLLQQQYEMNPNAPDICHMLGAFLFECGEHEQAAALIHRALQVGGHTAKRWHDLGVVMARTGHKNEAIRCQLMALEQDSTFASAHMETGKIYLEASQFTDAQEHFRRYTELVPEDGEGWGLLGCAYADGDLWDEGLDALERALELNPEHEYAYTRRCILLQELGRNDEAAAGWRRFLDRDPGRMDVLANLVEASPPDAVTEEVKRLEEAVAAGISHQDIEINACFAIAKWYDKKKDYDTAFRWYLKANKLKRGTFEYSLEDYSTHYKRTKSVYTHSFLQQRRAWGSVDSRPVLIVGLPRSGTSLTEQILSSHPDVYGCGETQTLAHLVRAVPEIIGIKGAYPEIMTEVTESHVSDLASRCLTIWTMKAGNAARFIDKNPFNHIHVGLFKLLFPHGRVIHCRRNILDTCLSNFTINYASHVSYAYDLRELGRYCRVNHAMMDHWYDVLGTEILPVDYEETVADLEGQVRRMLDFLGLPWHDDCLDFTRNQRAVKTASIDQVRQSLYTSSIGRWRRYENFLTPLIEALELSEDDVEKL